ncbi:unnamed protein product [Oppiella nova]|uniref:Solute carrier family 25 member 40 n=1 Tax=Oppiella nova TaxID=334625 RepID=A0A7R9M9T4_9ACAR|nr:unnamed protein product [Oppiella nova]CAG2172304.1 unnamed protein product [Oppiella nova]
MSIKVGDNKLLTMSDHKKSDLNLTPVQRLMSSCMGATVTALCTTPLDVVKTRLQAQQKDSLTANSGQKVGAGRHAVKGSAVVANRLNGHFGETFEMFVKISRTEGLTSLWSGLPATLVMAVPATALYFAVYDELRESLNRSLQLAHQPVWVPVLCGGVARTLTAITVSPIEMIRTKLQSKHMTYRQVGRALDTLVRTQGYQSLWRGLSATILRVVPFSCIYWANYEFLKSRFNDTLQPTFMVSFLCGAGAGTVASVATIPFDVVKTHRQIDWSDSRPQRVYHILRQIYRNQGFKGLAMVIPGMGVYFTSYDLMRVYLSQKFECVDSQPAWIPILSGGLARTLAAVIISPIEMIKTKMQSKHFSYSQVGRAVRHMVRTQGYGSLWTGINATILRDAPFSSVYWLVYEKMKRQLNAPIEPPVSVSFVCGATAGTVAALITHPFDVVKTHRQIELGEVSHSSRHHYKTSDILANIYRQNGYRGLFAGISPRVMRIAPACAIMITTFECGKAYFRQYNDSKLG